MNILVIGNGFDKAHGLPTGCDNFLDFLKVLHTHIAYPSDLPGYRKLVDRSKLCEENDSFRDFCLKCMNDAEIKSDKRLSELLSLMSENIWVEYFCALRIPKRNWVGCEGNLKEVIQAIDPENSKDSQYAMIRHSFDAALEKADINGTLRKSNDLSLTIEKLLEDLARFTRCLEIYLCLCLEFVPISKRLNVISEIGDIDAVLSFNYTDTFEKVYAPSLSKVPKYCYVHGKADLQHNWKQTNMVLGIDEYLDEELRNVRVNFIGFKKYYQRIFKQTSYDYTKWLDEREEKNIFFIGHSLDITDRDILRDIILEEPFNNLEKKMHEDDIHTTIFYHSKQSNASQIENLVRVLEYDKLNALARGTDRTRSICFKELC